jgi:hypothetical protein
MRKRVSLVSGALAFLAALVVISGCNGTSHSAARPATTSAQAASGTKRNCPDLKGSVDLPPGVQLGFGLDADRMRATDRLTAQLAVKDDQPTWTVAPRTTVVRVERGTRTVVGDLVVSGSNTVMGSSDDLLIPIDGHLERCDRPGSAVPPGTYGVRAGINGALGPPEYLAAEPVLTLTR